ncbi:hypothetical protein [Kocuria rosea]|uniref:Lipoprotein n=1 Tax=Kocuria rosea TaxID=1275 RepID=A0A4R5Y2B7_KOCRO|nr:hypothetical protein [Kocuria rosea]TDL38571.1 hypothetical protein E2R59_16825 [Kocuria rosea]
MTSRTSAALTATAVLLMVTACGPSPGSSSVPSVDLGTWAADILPAVAEGGFSIAGSTGTDGSRATGSTTDVEPGWYAVTMACAPADPGADADGSSGRISLRGEHGSYGEGDCAGSPVTTTVQLGSSDDSTPETITVAAEAEGYEAFWGVSAAPTTAPE